ncbi:MAG: GGDEF domain-containing protein [Gemmatimonadetes bacterium]|nr:GGDEF domain-containing protein [Gemmatimonadota bacterium]
MSGAANLSFTRRVPTWALAISGAALVIPVLVSVLVPEAYRVYTLLVWLLAIVPAFLLAYHRGWQGAALSLAAAMAVLSTTQAILVFTGQQLENWTVLLLIVGLFIAVSLGVGLVTELLHRAREEAAELALMDALTGLPNQRYGELFLEKEFEAARRGRALTIVLFDVDRLEQYNRAHGYTAGNEALQTFANVLAVTTRKMNLSARWGGGRFLSVVSSADIQGATVFTERVRASFLMSQPRYGPMSVSAGMAAYDVGMGTPNELLAAAEHALFLAKAAGRDRDRVSERRLAAGGRSAS